MSSSSTLRFIHLGDLHFWKVPLNPFLYLNKRFLGIGNLLLGGRARKFKQALAPDLVARIIELRPEVILFSGDFSTTALDSEFAAAREALLPAVTKATLGAASVPGNHDAYIPAALDGNSFITELGTAFGPVRGVSFRLMAPGIGVLAINATTNNGMGSHGRIDPQMIGSIQTMLEKHRRDLRRVMVLCHFPPEIPAALVRHKRPLQLQEATPLLDLLGALGLPVLWLHGHDHWRWIMRSPTHPTITYLNAGAPLMRHRGKPAPDLGFHEVTVDTGSESPRVATHRRSELGVWSSTVTAIPADPGAIIDLQ